MTAAMSFDGPAGEALVEFRATLDRDFGERLERAILYGSRARGDARPDSDFDVAVFIDGLQDYWAISNRLADISTAALEKHGGFIHATPFRAGSYQDRTPIMHEIRLDGRDL